MAKAKPPMEPCEAVKLLLTRMDSNPCISGATQTVGMSS